MGVTTGKPQTRSGSWKMPLWRLRLKQLDHVTLSPTLAEQEVAAAVVLRALTVGLGPENTHKTFSSYSSPMR